MLYLLFEDFDLGYYLAQFHTSLLTQLVEKPFTIEWEKMEDLEAKELKSENYIRLPFPGIPEDQLEAFSKLATVSVLLGGHHGLWDVTDEWNQLLPDYKFTQVADFIKEIWKLK